MNIKILLVDDRRADRFLIRRRLDAMGYPQIEEACNAEGAIEKAQETRPDLVLMDTQMPPGISGYAACIRIRQQDYGKCMAIIGMSTIPHIDKWRSAGADDFFDKVDIVEGIGLAGFDVRIKAALGKYHKNPPAADL